MRRFVRLTLEAVLLLIVLAGASLGVALWVLDDEDYLDIAALAPHGGSGLDPGSARSRVSGPLPVLCPHRP